MQTALKAVTDDQMEALWVFISKHPSVKHELAKKVLIWLTMQSELLTRPVKISVRKDQYGVEMFSRIIQNGVHDMGSHSSGPANIDLFCAAMGSTFRFGHFQQSDGSDIWISEDHFHCEISSLEMPTEFFLDRNVHVQQWFTSGRRSS
jgi:hypothetical protein